MNKKNLTNINNSYHILSIYQRSTKYICKSGEIIPRYIGNKTLNQQKKIKKAIFRLRFLGLIRRSYI